MSPSSQDTFDNIFFQGDGSGESETTGNGAPQDHPVTPNPAQFRQYWHEIRRRSQSLGSAIPGTLRGDASPEEMLEMLRGTFHVLSEKLVEARRRSPGANILASTIDPPVQVGGVPNEFLGSPEIVDNFFNSIKEIFARLDGIQAFIQNLLTAESRSTPAPSGPSTSRTLDAEEVPLHRQHLQAVEDYISVVNDPADSSFWLRLSRNERYLRSALKEFSRQLAEVQKNTPNYVHMQSLAGFVTLLLYELTWEKEHLDMGETITSLALAALDDVMPNAMEFRHTVIGNWVFGQRLRAQTTGDGDKLDISIDLMEPIFNAFKEQPAHSLPPRARLVLGTELGICLFERYNHLESLADLNSSIAHFEYLCIGTPATDNLKYYLGHAYLQRYLAVGDLNDLDKAFWQTITASTDDGVGDRLARREDPDRSALLQLSAICLEQRFLIQLDFTYLDKAIENCDAAIELLKEEHPLYIRCKSDLAMLRILRYASTEDSADLNKASEQILTAIAVGRAERNTQIPMSAIWGLVLVLSGEDIDEGIRLISKSRRDFAGPSFVESQIEMFLSRAVLHRYNILQLREDLDTALQHAKLSFAKARESSPRRAEMAVELGRILMLSYELDRTSSTREEAISHFKTGAELISARPTVRCEAANEWANASEDYDPDSYCVALECGLELLPNILWSGDRMPVQYRLLSSQSVMLASRSATHAIGVGNLRNAIMYLEKGRNLLWSKALRLRIGTDRVYGENLSEDEHLARYLSREVHDDAHQFLLPSVAEIVDKSDPELVASMQILQSVGENATRRMIELVGEERAKAYFANSKRSRNQNVQELRDAAFHRAAARWEELKESSMRHAVLSDLELLHFLDDERFVDLIAQGPIVIINTYGAHCDAIVVSHPETEERTAVLRHVLLPGMSGDLALAWAEMVRQGVYELTVGEIKRQDFEDDVLVPVLRGLWYDMVQPILEDLRDHGGIKQRIWWYPTGALAFLPIHAAGPYEGDEPGLTEILASSYISTISSLVRACNAEDAPMKFLAVGMPETSGLPSLPHVEGEVAAIEKLFNTHPTKLTTLIGEQATAYKVSKSLTDNTWLHFACHANQDDEYPFHSAFYMHDGPLKLSKLMQLNLSRVQFAFLSSCLTAAGDATLPDECIHLAAGMQFSGVRSVIATMWYVMDQAAVRATKRVYHHLLKGMDGNVGSSAKALQLTMLDLKKNKVPLAYRVAFIHTGI